MPAPLRFGLAFAALVLGFLAGPGGVFSAWAEDKVPDAEAASGPLRAGGPFELIDHRGRPVTDRDFRGRYMLVYFGYANCPGICPTALRGMAAALDILGPEGESVAPILVTVDPKRDTVETLGPAVAKIHPRLIGLTGTFEQLNAAAKAYRISAKQVAVTLEGKQPIFQHSAFIYLMGPDGEMLTLFPPIVDPEQMAAAIRGYIG